MSLHKYTLAMDFARERYGLSVSASLYEIVVKVVTELKSLEEKLQKLEKSCQKKPKQLKSKKK